MKIRSMLPSIWNEQARDITPFRELQSEIDKLFGEFSSGMPAFGGWGKSSKMPVRLDIAETGKAVEVMAELPGVDEKDIDVSINGDVLSIKAEKRTEKDDKQKDYHVIERSYGLFERSLRLPFQPNAHKVEASFDKGVLKLVIEKPVEEMAKSQKVSIKAAA